MLPNKLLIVDSRQQVGLLKSKLSENWMVSTIENTLVGRKFDLILLGNRRSRINCKRFDKQLSNLKDSLSEKGKLIQI